MNLRSLLLAGLLFRLVLVPVAAQSIPPRLVELINRAQTQFPSLREQAARVRAAETQVELTRTARNPHFSAEGAYYYLAPTPSVTFTQPGGEKEALQFIPDHNLDGHLSYKQTVYDFGHLNAAVDRARKDVTTARDGLALTRHNLSYQVAAAYYSIAFLQRAIAVQDQLILDAEALLGQIRYRVDKGTALPLDVLTQQVRLENTRNRRLDLINQLTRQRQALAFLTGIPADSLLVDSVAFDLAPAPVSAEESLRTASANNPELRLANDQIETARADIAVVEKVFSPTVSLFANAGIKNGYVPNIQQLTPNLTAGVSVSAPLFTGPPQRLQRELSQINLEAAQARHDLTADALSRDVAMTISDIRNREEQIEHLQIQLEQATQAYEVAGNSFRNGILTTLELQQAQTNIEEASLAVLQARYQLQLSYLELNRLEGNSLR